MSLRSTKDAQEQIIRALRARPSIDPADEITRRVEFLCQQIANTGQHTLVLGISGGVDSTVTGRLAQLAVEKARQDGIKDARFVAMRLPYGEQHDEEDAQLALDFIAPDELLTVDIKPATDAMLNTLESAGLTFRDPGHRDFNTGNAKARQRMIAQYSVAGARRGLVLGTDQAAEALTGFFTKFGDGACDLAPLTGLTKRQVRAVAAELGAIERLVGKTPTADLETLDPGKTDEEALGVTYEEIDDFLEGKTVSDTAYENIIDRYTSSQHKREMPKEPV
jgi:NAD+ synthase